eukprot:365698-Chlamydomonas_euryale.AAC.9
MGWLNVVMRDSMVSWTCSATSTVQPCAWQRGAQLATKGRSHNADVALFTAALFTFTAALFTAAADKMPSDLTLKLPSGGKLPAFWQLLRFASDDFLNAPGGDTMPGQLDIRLHGACAPQVDGSLCAWTYIPMWLHPQHDEPDLTLGGAYVLLPVAHKYGFSKLVDRVVGFVRSHALIDVHSVYINYAIYWLALSEDLQLDELRDFCWSVKGGWSCEKVAACLRGGGCKDSMPHERRFLFGAWVQGGWSVTRSLPSRLGLTSDIYVAKTLTVWGVGSGRLKRHS